MNREITIEHAADLWHEINNRVARFGAADRKLEVCSLLNDIARAGGTLEVFVIFCEAFLSTTRA